MGLQPSHLAKGLCCVTPTKSAAFRPLDEVAGGGGFCCSTSRGLDDDGAGFAAHVWRGVGLPGFVFPELRNDSDGVKSVKDKPDFAICVSGGGMRATTCALGWLRALFHFGFLQKARYLCSNSGGSWINLAMSFQKMVPLEVFLGRYIPPEKLTPEEASMLVEGSYSETVADADFIIGNFVRGIVCDVFTTPDWLPDELVEDWRKVRSWERAVGHAFLDRYELGDLDAAVGLSGRTQNVEATGVPGVHTACDDSRLPFPVVVGSIVVPNKDHLFHSFEFTPIYSGVPAYIDNDDVKLGNVLVETFALSSTAPDPPKTRPQVGQKETIPLNIQWIPPLSQIAGISSAFIAQVYANATANGLWDIMGCPEMTYWNGIDHTHEVYPFADGGGTDNLGLYPPLRRKTKKILVGFATGQHPDDDKWAADFYDMSGYFGAVPEKTVFSTAMGEVSAGPWNQACQVFEKHKFQELIDELVRKKHAGEPLAVRQTLRVLPNSWQGITEGYTVEVLWLVNGGEKKWLQQVPPDTRDMIQEKMPNFPYFSVMQVDYDPEEVSCLSNLAAWNIHQVQKDLRSFVEG
mmetsp:Transcript_10574/g.24057  ORF Transcript_10574/g.24057 Transcript_10574/m.24057 type:complete len:575 (+) Transcript_10574:98-1822(+)